MSSVLQTLALLLVARASCAARVVYDTEPSAAESCDASELAKAKQQFSSKGYTVLRGVLTAEEVDAIEERFDHLMHPFPEVAELMGKDYGDQSAGPDVDPANFSLINVNNPGRYLAGFSPNILVEKANASVVAILGEGMQIDYEQLLEKVPGRKTAVFPWHQDMQYWPKHMPEGVSTRTATFSLALSDADETNGCLKMIPRSGLAKKLLSDRINATSEDGADEKRAIVLPLTDAELASATPLPVKRGDVTVHDEWIVHGSGGNPSDRVRKTYVVAFRDAAMVQYERSIGFTHSYNDEPETLRRIRAGQL